MKSRVNVAPELPPPPYTSAIITPADGAALTGVGADEKADERDR